jgi:N-acetylmuramic acid 6-phosphate etherase
VYDQLPTERVDPEGPELDRLTPAEIARLLLTDEERARDAVRGALDSIGDLCGAAAAALQRGGRLIYIGAGTSGRLGVLDASEMGPTFGAPPGQVVGLLAGAPEALTASVEGAEDDPDAGATAMESLTPGPADLAVGITMSGTAAYVDAALRVASGKGATTALLTAHPGSAIEARLRVVLDLGPELLAGSTRLKGGSATKIVLNMVSTSAMAASGAVYRNRMVRVRPTNRKLRARAERLVAELGEVAPNRARDLLARAGDDVPVAVVMARRALEADEARAALETAGGVLREALA